MISYTPRQYQEIPVCNTEKKKTQQFRRQLCIIRLSNENVAEEPTLQLKESSLIPNVCPDTLGRFFRLPQSVNGITLRD